MALTESQKLDIATILGVTYIEVQEQVTYLGSTHLTSEVESKISNELDRWTTAGTKFTRIVDKETNYGAVIDPEKEKDDIRKNLATLLYFTELMKGGSGTGARLQRA